MSRDDLETCEWPFPPCTDPATGLITYTAGNGQDPHHLSTKSLCGTHFREVEGILWVRGLTWTAEPVGLARKLLALQHRADAEDLRNRAEGFES